MRTAKINRETSETKIMISLNIDGMGNYNIKTPVSFFTHMLEVFSKYSNIDLTISAEGDIDIDQHHLIEDLGYVLGKTINQAIGNRVGIERAGFFIFPMDDSLVLSSVDLSGRAYIQFNAEFRRQYVGKFDTDLTSHFFEAFSRGAGINIAIKVLSGNNDHHKLEAIFKSFAKAIRQACMLNIKQIDRIPSTKGLIDL